MTSSTRGRSLPQRAPSTRLNPTPGTSRNFNFVAPDRMHADLEAAARAAGVNRGEWVRRAVARALWNAGVEGYGGDGSYREESAPTADAAG